MHCSCGTCHHIARHRVTCSDDDQLRSVDDFMILAASMCSDRKSLHTITYTIPMFTYFTNVMLSPARWNLMFMIDMCRHLADSAADTRL